MRALHHRLAAAARRGALRPTRVEGRAEGQERSIFDGRQRAGAARRRGRRMCNAGARLAPADQIEVDLHGRAADADQPRDRARPHQFFADRRADRPAVVERPEPAEHPDPHRDRAQDPRRLRRRAGVQIAQRRLQPDRAPAGGVHGRCPAAQGGVPRRRRHP